MEKLNRAIDSRMSRLALIEEEITQLRERRALTRQKWDSLQDRVEDLIPLVEPYLAMRNCFISTFKRDKLGNATEEDLEIIKERTFSAKEFEGDASTDVQLYYSPHKRTDWYVFEQLYGLPAPVVKQLTHRDTLTVLNTHAAILASNTQKGTEIFYKLFSVFIELFEKSNYDPAYLEGFSTPVSDAYWAFIKCWKGEVAGVDSQIVD
ncbi:hypothetical protein B9Z19DRAFT_1047285 [Tuber borchii]|uniref:Uncharacterized protein n=1 Tax=Tuber borchii TaxID=42251 RepID=A0A2T6ZUP6_TUBBO|nr:hypothetical protein B9Z19DRAFT_1047285 [Tuber borchii]